jgi:hypothetical protein
MPYVSINGGYMNLYAARDRDGSLIITNKKLEKIGDRWDSYKNDYDFISLSKSWLKDVKWKDDAPTEVKLTINVVDEKMAIDKSEKKLRIFHHPV